MDDTSPTFKGFEKMADNSNHWQLTNADNSKIKQTKWCATEKVHGANFCWVVEADRILGANRTQILDTSNNFFGWKSVLPKLETNLKRLFELLNEKNNQYLNGLANSPEKLGDLKTIYVFGELFGGVYPNMESPPGIKPVQTGIYYSPNIEFIGFDCAVQFGHSESREYLNFEDTLALFKLCDIFCVEPLFVGTYNQAVNYTNRFESTIAKRLGLTPVSNNLAEGLVIKPMRNVLVTTKKGLERAIIKSKIAEFSEDKRYQGAEKWTSESQDNWSDSTDILLAEMRYELLSLVTTQRIDNTVSKIGHVDPNDRDAMRSLLEAYISDILSQIEESVPAEWSQLSPSQREELQIELRQEAVKLFRKHFNIKK